MLAALLALGVSAPAALAGSETLNFETPVVSGGSPQGEALGSQYLAQGAEFTVPPFETEPEGIEGCRTFGEPHLAVGAYVYRDPVHARNGTQVARSYCPPGGENFSSTASMFVRLTRLTDSVSLYAGEEGGGEEIFLVGYELSGKVAAVDALSPSSANVALHLSISTGSATIAYFSVFEKGTLAYPLEIELTYEVSEVAPPPAIVPECPQCANLSGYAGQTVDVPVTVRRENGANQPITLNVLGLPAGVRLAGDTTIPAGSSATELAFEISPEASPISVPITLQATTPGVLDKPTEPGNFTVFRALGLALERREGLGGVQQQTLTLGACTAAKVSITDVQLLPGSSTLTVSGQGDTSGLAATLSASSLSAGAGATLTISSTGAGGSGAATYTITASHPGYTSAAVTVTVNRTAPTTTQGVYVNQGPQRDYGQLEPSGTGASGGGYQGVRLVAGKTTVVRVYGQAGTQAGLPGAVGLLYGYVNGHALPGSPLAAQYGPPGGILAGPGSYALGGRVSDAELESEANAYTFTLPKESWTSAGLVPLPGGASGNYYPPGRRFARRRNPALRGCRPDPLLSPQQPLHAQRGRLQHRRAQL